MIKIIILRQHPDNQSRLTRVHTVKAQICYTLFFVVITHFQLTCTHTPPPIQMRPDVHELLNVMEYSLNESLEGVCD